MASLVAQLFAKAPQGSPDLDRVLALPRRPPVETGSVTAEALVEMMTRRLRRPDRPPGAACGCRELGRSRCLERLLFSQAWTLYEAGICGGLLGPQGVGSGKTLCNILAPMVVRDCRMAVVLTQPGLVGQLVAEHRAAAEHFVVPSLVAPGGAGLVWLGRPTLHVVPYSQLQRPEATSLLRSLAPDLIIADEAHALKSRRAARTLRVLRHFAASDGVRLCAWSGTLTSKSLDDFAHLAALALGEGSPLPVDPDEVMRWAAAVDPADWPAPAGALRALAREGETVREAVRRRVLETRGVVATALPSLPGCNVVLRERKVRLPRELREMMAQVRLEQRRPDGEEFTTPMETEACCRQLACGFYYRWRFPGRPDPELVERWFEARKRWHREVRAKLERAVEHMDSPLLLANAAQRHAEGYRGELPTWESEHWAAWRDVRNLVAHETEAVWVDDFLAADAAEWALSRRGVVWYEHAAFGRRVGELSQLPVHGGGPNAEAEILAERGDRSIIASIAAHGTGRDGLQRLFAEQYVSCPPQGGQAWEQLLGRLHRPGQEADEVVTWVPRHAAEFRDAIDRAVRLAKYVEGMTSNAQRLLCADVEWEI